MSNAWLRSPSVGLLSEGEDYWATLRLALDGILVGAALGSWEATYLRSYLFGVSPWDVQALSGSVLVAVALASLAAIQPSYRASRTDPLATLRCE
jgi:ABC-type lipoprotein release transport system permease subunit